MTDRKLQTTTVIHGEEVSTFALGEEFTTEALGEEHPTTLSGEGPVSAEGEVSRRGGPFGAY